MDDCGVKKMTIFSSILLICIAGSCGAWQPDIDINRARISSRRESQHKRNTHIRRSIFPHKFNDGSGYDNSRFAHLQSPHIIPDPSSAKPKAVKVHQPREDPRLFYQSATYLRELDGNSLNNEVTAIYPGKDEVRASKNNYFRRPYSARLRVKTNDVLHDDICVTCPHDRTLIVKSGYDRVILQSPRLKACYGHTFSRDVKFVSMYGPKFGTLLQKGSYGIVGQIKYKNEVLRYCTMKVDVLMQTCPLPKYLIADCKDGNKTCSFTCRNPVEELNGSSALACGDDMTWVGQLPSCSVRSWCKPLLPAAHGKITCRGNTVNGWGLAEGTTCRINCSREWKPNTRTMATCWKGTWSRDFICLPKKDIPK